jgi:hypothetical protein
MTRRLGDKEKQLGRGTLKRDEERLKRARVNRQAGKGMLLTSNF